MPGIRPDLSPIQAQRNRNERVVKNMNTAAALPAADARASHERRALSAAMAISTMPGDDDVVQNSLESCSFVVSLKLIRALNLLLIQLYVMS